jgi:hypothetical protein
MRARTIGYIKISDDSACPRPPDVRNDLYVREIDGTSSPGTGASGARGVHETLNRCISFLSLSISHVSSSRHEWNLTHCSCEVAKSNHGSNLTWAYILSCSHSFSCSLFHKWGLVSPRLCNQPASNVKTSIFCSTRGYILVALPENYF